MGTREFAGNLNVTGTLQQNGTNISPVTANPTLAGTEEELTGLQIGDTKWKMPSGGGASAIETTWAELKALRDAGELVPGSLYRITDYTCTTTQTNTSSAGHLFDVIVLALELNKLSEEAWAAHHSGDTYFVNSKLEAWRLWYSIDNDTTRFAWADSVNGKGVIYRMIDEFENDCSYDFKNILYAKRKSIDTQSTGYYIREFNYGGYTFSNYQSGSYVDLSLNTDNVSKIRKNKITFSVGPNYASSALELPNIAFFQTNISSMVISGTRIKDSKNISLNTGASTGLILEYCNTMYFGSSIKNSSIIECNNGGFTGTLYYSEFYYCSNAFLGSTAYSVGRNLSNTTLGRNTFCNFSELSYVYKNAANSNSANWSHVNMINCSYIEHYSGSSIPNYLLNINISGIKYINFSISGTASSSNQLQNIAIHPGIAGASSSNPRTISVDRNLAYSVDIYANGSQMIILND